MKNRLFPWLGRLAASVALLALPGILSALSVIAPDFNDLVDEADSIFQGDVLSVHSEWSGAGADRHIETYVQFRVIRVFKGSAPNPQTLQIFGGTVGDQSMKISGLPQFQVGASELLFVKGNGTDLCPLVGVFHGRFHVTKDLTTGVERIALHDGRPLTVVTQIGQSAETPAPVAARVEPAASGMTIAEFGQRIQARLAATATPSR
jgi:hypothetical protein